MELTELGRFRGEKSLNVDWGTRSSSTGLRCQVTNGAPGQWSAKNGLLINQRSACRLSPDCLHPEWQPSDGTLNAKPRSTRLFLLVRITVAAMLITSENMRAQCRDIFVLSLGLLLQQKKVEIVELKIQSLNFHCVPIILNMSHSCSNFLF